MPFFPFLHVCSNILSCHGDVLQYLSFQQVGRSLFCLGLLIRYGSSLLDASASNTRNIDVASSINLFKKYLQAEDFIIKVRALQVQEYYAVFEIFFFQLVNLRCSCVISPGIRLCFHCSA